MQLQLRPLIALTLASLSLAACGTDTSQGIHLAGAKSSLEPTSLSTNALQEPAQEVSAEHKRLLQGVGHFSGTMTAYGMGPEPMVTTATDTIEALGAYWIQSRFECSFMGVPYVGTGHFGYDVERGKHLGTWVDNMTPALAIMEGETNEDGQQVMRWTGPDSAGALVPHWSVSEHRADGYTSTFYMGEGEGELNMVLEMTRTEGEHGEDGHDDEHDGDNH